MQTQTSEGGAGSGGYDNNKGCDEKIFNEGGQNELFDRQDHRRRKEYSRIIFQQDKSDVRQYNTINVPRIPNQSWHNKHQSVCNRRCMNDEIHRTRWFQAYLTYLQDMYSIYTKEVKLSKASFNVFVEFVYQHSSGYINPYA